MEPKYDNAQAEIADLKRQLTELQSAIAADPEFAKCRSENEELRQRANTLNGLVADRDANITELTAALAKAENERDNSYRKLNNHRIGLPLSTQAQESLKAENIELQAELAALKAAPIPPRMEIRGTHPYGFRTGEWARVLGVGQMADSEPRESIIVQFPDGEIDTWPVKDPLDPYETRDLPASPAPTPPQWQDANDARNTRIAELEKQVARADEYRKSANATAKHVIGERDMLERIIVAALVKAGK